MYKCERTYVCAVALLLACSAERSPAPADPSGGGDGGNSAGGSETGGSETGGSEVGGGEAPHAMAGSGGGAPTDPPGSQASFDERCAAPGVLVCEGFDDPGSFVAASWPDSGLYPPWGETEVRGYFDEGIKTSGAGSLRFDIHSQTGSDTAGSWRQYVGDAFGAGDTFYVQFRQRLSPEMLSIDWYGQMGTMWKQAIFHGSDATCSDVELTTQVLYDEGIPHMYTDCGARGLFTNDGVPPTLLQQGDYNCSFGDVNAEDCFMYPQQRWTTYSYRIAIGEWGVPNSTIQAWVQHPGEPPQQWVSMQDFALYNEQPGSNDYAYVTLLPYMTGKDASVAHPTARTWYDELIVSTQPIAGTP